MYNGMAAGRRLMSAASFISLSGRCTCGGFGHASGQAGGFGLPAGAGRRFLPGGDADCTAPAAMGLYTVPGFFHVRFGGRWPRIIAALAAVLCSFTYVVAQIHGGV